MSLNSNKNKPGITAVSLVKVASITETTVRERISDALKRRIGPGKEYDYALAADSIAESERNIKAWVLGECLPCQWKLLRLFCVLGPEFANEILRIAAMDGAHVVTPDNDDAIDVAAEMSTAASEVMEALRGDMRVDHTEMPRVVEKIKRAVEEGQQFIAAHDRGV